MQQINFLKTRSFWMMVGAVITSFTGIPTEVLATVGGGLADGAGQSPQVVAEGIINQALPAVLAGGAWLERIFGKKNVVFGKALY